MSGDAEAAACESPTPPETPPGAGRLPEVGSGNFLQESQKSWSNILETPDIIQTSQELRMLSSVTINCQVTKIVIYPGSQLSVL